jgi:hypothetical protein
MGEKAYHLALLLADISSSSFLESGDERKSFTLDCGAT